MATPLDLQEQEQLDALKAFWKRYGNALTWALTLVLAAYAGYNGWTWWQRDQGVKAAAMHAELERAATAGDAERVATIFEDLKQRFPGTVYAGQGGLLAARVAAEKGKPEAAQAALAWVADKAVEVEYRAVAKLRAAALMLDAKKPQEALAMAESAKGQGFDALVDDRRGDALLALGRKDDAREAYRSAWKAMSAQDEYRRIVEAKLASLGVDMKAATPAAGAAS